VNDEPTTQPEAPFVPTTESVLNPPPAKSLAGITPTLGDMALDPPPPTEDQQVAIRILKARNMKMFSNRAHRSHNRRNVDRQRRGKDVGEQGFAVTCANKATRHFEHIAKVGKRQRAAEAALAKNPPAAPRELRRRAWLEEGNEWKPETPAPARAPSPKLVPIPVRK
jgi:hypothetical protein